jgi:hypothetical protein
MLQQANDQRTQKIFFHGQLQKKQTGPNDTKQQFIAYNTILEEKEEFFTIFRL